MYPNRPIPEMPPNGYQPTGPHAVTVYLPARYGATNAGPPNPIPAIKSIGMLQQLYSSYRILIKTAAKIVKGEWRGKRITEFFRFDNPEPPPVL
jgi:hypothetical protein